MLNKPFYDPKKTYDDNFDQGPFGAFTDGKVVKESGEPKHSFLGYPIYTPFGIPAGPILNSNFVKPAFEKGFDVVTYKTQRSTVIPVNQFPNVLYVQVDGDLTLEKAKNPLLGNNTEPKDLKHLTITNSFGNPSRGPGFWQEDMKKAISYARKGQLLVASVVGTIKEGASKNDYYDDFAYSAELAKDTGVKVIELNLSCPNVANEGVICYTKDAVEAICRKTKEKVGNTKVLMKVGYYSSDQQELLEDIVKSVLPFIDGIATINTIPGPIVNEKGEQALPGPNRLSSGICGAGVKWAGIDMVKRLVQLRDKLHSDFAIVGVGGVMTPEDYQEFKNAGADLVQSATGAMWNPLLAQEIKQRYK